MKSIIRTLKLVAKLEPKLLPATVVNLAAQNIAPYITTLLSAYVLDAIIAGRKMEEILPTVTAVLILRLILMAIGEVTFQLTLAGGRLMHGLFMVKKSEKTLSMDYEELNSPKNGELRDRINGDDMYGWGISGVYFTFSDVLGRTISMVTAAVIVIPMINVKGWGGAYLAATVCAVFICAVLNGRFTKKQQEIRDSYKKSRSYASYYLWGNGVDYKRGKDIRVYSAQPLVKGAVEADETERAGRRRFVSFTRKTGAFNGAFGAVLQGSSYIYVVLSAISGGLGAGDVVKFASSLYSFWGSLSDFVSQAASLKQLAERFSQTLDFLELDERIDGKAEFKESGSYVFEFKDVSFKYPGSEEYALKNVSAKIRTGERTAIVGLNGSGKTTFIKLLCRLYHPTEGVITLNGVNIEEYSFNSYVKVPAVVFQDFKLFPMTLGENVAASEEYDEAKVRAVLETSGFGERLNSLEKGCAEVLYKDYEENGIDISGGEAQKIALSRALYKDAPFMILDEPTAALDPIAEYEIYSRFNAFTEGKGAVYISHRLSSCVFCDRILVFENGQIVQSGAHGTLLEEDGLYARLWNAQAQYYE